MEIVLCDVKTKLSDGADKIDSSNYTSKVYLAVVSVNYCQTTVSFTILKFDVSTVFSTEGKSLNNEQLTNAELAIG